MKSNIEKTYTHCNNCGSNNFKKIAQGWDLDYDSTTDDVFNVVQCNKCTFFYLNPRPADSELATIYPNHYQSYSLANDESQKKSLTTRLRQWVYSLRLRKALKDLDLKKPIDLLDVGCADGWMLDCYKSIKPLMIKTYGVEFNSGAARAAQAKGHEVFYGRIEDIEFGSQKFDFINISHVIEHLSDPSAMLKKLNTLLKPEGRIVVETPNIHSVDGLLFRKGTWGGYHFPRHWVFFEPKTLREMAGKSQLEIEKLYFHACPVFWHWTFHNFFSRSKYFKLCARFFRPSLIFKGGVSTFFYLSFFTLFDRIILLFRLPTSNMMAVMRKKQA